MKRHIVASIILLLLAAELLGQLSTINKNNISMYPKGFLGASVMIGTGVPFVSYGVGGRLYYVNPNVKYMGKDWGTFAEIEWNRRGGWDLGKSNYPGEESEPHILDYLDLGMGIRWGDRFFVASGVTMGILLHKGDAVDWPDEMDGLDLGSIFILGYFLGEERNSFLSFDTKYSALKAYDNPDYFLNSNNLTWGFVYGIKL